MFSLTTVKRLRMRKSRCIHYIVNMTSSIRDVVQSFGKIRYFVSVQDGLTPLFLSCMDFPNLWNVQTSWVGGCGGRSHTLLCFKSILMCFPTLISRFWHSQLKSVYEFQRHKRLIGIKGVGNQYKKFRENLSPKPSLRNHLKMLYTKKAMLYFNFPISTPGPPPLSCMNKR